MPTYNPNFHHRQSIRLFRHDYSNGCYIVTICTFNRTHLLGSITDGRITLSEIGIKADKCWRSIPNHFSNAMLDDYVIMPNHMHGIIILNNPHSGSINSNDDPFVCGRLKNAYPRAHGPECGSFGAVIGSFKSAVTRMVNRDAVYIGHKIWQKGYFEHLIRNEKSLQMKRRYIACNPSRWDSDEYNNHIRTGGIY